MSPDLVATEWASRVGQVTHRLVCELAPEARSMDPYQLGEEALRRARELVSDGQVRRGPAARARAVGLSLAYLRGFVPGGDWTLLGTEHELQSSRIDLVWTHPLHGVLLDEIKTMKGRGLDEGLVASDLAQAQRHVAGGRSAFGGHFLGLRVVTLGGLHTAVAVLPRGGPIPLVASGLHPDELPGGAS